MIEHRSSDEELQLPLSDLNSRWRWWNCERILERETASRNNFKEDVPLTLPAKFVQLHCPLRYCLHAHLVIIETTFIFSSRILLIKRE